MTMPNFYINFLNKAAKSLLILYDFAVASLADAWIKIQIMLLSKHRDWSHPSRMRGLKLTSYLKNIGLDPSHPMWMRGLKQIGKKQLRQFLTSHPLWVCELKGKRKKSGFLYNLKI